MMANYTPDLRRSNAMVLYTMIEGEEVIQCMYPVPIIAWAMKRDGNACWAEPVLPYTVDEERESVGLPLDDGAVLDIKLNEIFPSLAQWKANEIDAAENRAKVLALRVTNAAAPDSPGI
jgi:hypothetical protein